MGVGHLTSGSQHRVAVARSLSGIAGHRAVDITPGLEGSCGRSGFPLARGSTEDHHAHRCLTSPRTQSVAIPPRVLTTDPVMNVRLALAGAGVTMVREDRVLDHISAGDLVPVLEEFCAPFPGYYLYYPQRRHASPALRALVEYLRRRRRSSR